MTNPECKARFLAPPQEPSSNRASKCTLTSHPRNQRLTSKSVFIPRAPCTPALAHTSSLDTDLTRNTRAPLHPAALASVPYGIVLVRVRYQGRLDRRLRSEYFKGKLSGLLLGGPYCIGGHCGIAKKEKEVNQKRLLRVRELNPGHPRDRRIY